MGYFAQKNYTQIQGISGKYPISSIGCFLTSFCNLEAKYLVNVDPPTLNAFLRDNNLFIDVDDGVRDDVAWDTIIKFDPHTTVRATGLGTPPDNFSIVKFVYNGGKTHFCLVYNAASATIIDSWDGVVKPWSIYGGPKAWASYHNDQGGLTVAQQKTIWQALDDTNKDKDRLWGALDQTNKRLDKIDRPGGEMDVIYQKADDLEKAVGAIKNNPAGGK